MEAPHPRLAALLEGPSLWHGIEYHDEVDSTNDLAAEQARRGAPPGLVVVADHQRAGRGRRGRSWEDAADTAGAGASLLLSCLVALPERAATLAPLAAGLAVHDAVRRAGADPDLKWPNDVLLGERKCAGVLVESLTDLRRLVVGIGVDLDWRGVERGGETADWTSVAEETGAEVERWGFLADLLGSLESWLGDVTTDPSVLLARYRSRCVTVGRRVRVLTPGGALAGTAVDLDRDGSLTVRSEDGTVSVQAGDVEHLA